MGHTVAPLGALAKYRVALLSELSRRSATMTRHASQFPDRPHGRADSGAETNAGHSERSAAHSGCSAGISHTDAGAPQHRDDCTDGYGTPEGTAIVDQDPHRKPDE
jgi:hypothetical protein